MMYSENKKYNKTLLIVVSFLLFISSILCFNPSWLSKYYDDTLCAPELSGVQYNLVGRVYYVGNYLSGVTNYTRLRVETFDTSVDYLYGYTYNLSYDPTGLTHLTTSIVFSWQSIEDVDHYAYNVTFAIERNINYNNLNLICTNTETGIKYTFASNNEYVKVLTSNLDIYYNTGLLDGKNEVLNNPNDFDLYTYADYEEYGEVNYELGYGSGFQNGGDALRFGQLYNAQYGIDFSLPNGIVSYNNLEVLYRDTGTEYTQASIDYIEDYATSNNAGFDALTVNFNAFEYVNGSTVFSITNYLPLFKLHWYLVDTDGHQFEFKYSTRVADATSPVTLSPSDIVEVNATPNSEINGRTIVKLIVPFDTYNNDVLNNQNITSYLEVFENISFYQFGVVYSDGFNAGFASGEEVGLRTGYNNGYNNGYDIGYNTGKSDGINSAHDYTFYSLISSVVDAPLDMFKSIFNFELLGVNLFAFFTGLITLCIILFILRIAKR